MFGILLEKQDFKIVANYFPVDRLTRELITDCFRSTLQVLDVIISLLVVTCHQVSLYFQHSSKFYARLWYSTCLINQAVELNSLHTLNISDGYDKEINRLPDRSFSLLTIVDCIHAKKILYMQSNTFQSLSWLATHQMQSHTHFSTLPNIMTDSIQPNCSVNKSWHLEGGCQTWNVQVLQDSLWQVRKEEGKWGAHSMSIVAWSLWCNIPSMSIFHQNG